MGRSLGNVILGMIVVDFTMRAPVRARIAAWPAVALLAALFVLSACTASPEPAESISPTASPGSVATPSTDASPGPTEAAPLPVATGGLDDVIELTTGMTITLASISAVEVTAETPGELSGSAVAVVVRVRNDSNETQRVDSAVVTLTTPEGELGIPTIGGGADPLAGDVAPGATVEGLYIFMLDPAADRDVTISVNYAAGEPVAEFAGRTS